MTRILVPTDFSANADQAIDFAVQLALKKGKKIDLLHTYEKPETGSGFMINIADILKEDAERDMKSLLDRMLAKYPEIEFQSKIAYGDLSKTISKLKKNFDLVVIGTKGATGAKEIFIGSNATNIIDDCAIPTIVVPEEASTLMPSSMTIALDMKPISDEIFDRIKLFNKDLGLGIDFVTVNNKVTEKQETLELPFENAAINFLENENIELALVEYMEHKNAAILTIINRKRTFFKSLFHKSISKSAVMHFNAPMLILQD
jgi:nucleotide-binding universal stress UspA family protein